MQVSEEQLKEYHDLYNRLQNETRRDILAFVYQEPRNYTQLIDHTNLKPGSLYHHLNILKPLIEKEAHGLYRITELGEEIAEKIGLVKDKKPEVSVDQMERPEIIDEEPVVETGENLEKNNNINTTLQDNLWFGWPNYILSIFIFTITVVLAINGVALAGSAIYSVGTLGVVFAYDVIAFALGFIVIYTVETLITTYEIKDRLKFSISIRLISMLPATVVGISLLLLFLGDIIPPAFIYPFIFAITVVLGYYIMVNGLYYLRGLSLKQASYISSIPIGIDILLGIVVLFTV